MGHLIVDIIAGAVFIGALIFSYYMMTGGNDK